MSKIVSKGGGKQNTFSYTSMLWKPPTNAATFKKVLKNSKSQVEIKYRSQGFEKFQTLKLPAKTKIEYYKIHKELYNCKKGQDKMKREEHDIMERIMPIYSKEDIIQIKNGNV